MIVKNLIKDGSMILKNKMINSYQLDAELILSNIMNVPREYIQVNDHLSVSNKTKEKYKLNIKRRSKNEPVAYIINKKEFWSLPFYVNKYTLVPRPETELMIYDLVKIYKNKNINILDIGTGCGCILISILKELKFSRGTGIDICHKAIKIAKRNSVTNGVFNRSTFLTSSINSYFSGKYDLIVSNPPYIPLAKIKNLSGDILQYEPLAALNGGIDGLDLIKKVIYKSVTLLKKKGKLAIEIDHGQYLKVFRLLKRCGFGEINNICDYKGNIRCIISTRI
jgi:release factor glutamine methyltransferase